MRRQMKNLALFSLLLFLAGGLTALNIIDVNGRVSCHHMKSNELPVYILKQFTEFYGSEVTLQLKRCAKPTNETYCSDVNSSGWVTLSDCTIDGSSMDVLCTFPEETEERDREYLRIFIYDSDTLPAVTEKFMHSFQEGCICADEHEYLPQKADFKVTYNRSRNGSVILTVKQPKYLRTRITNSYKYDFYFHAGVKNVSKVMPSRVADPLEFDLEGLKACKMYAFQVSIKYLNCKFQKGKYYSIHKFTFDPNGACQKSTGKSSIDVTLIFAILLPVICVLIIAIICLVKFGCIEQRRQEQRLVLDSESPSCSSTPKSAITDSTAGDQQQVKTKDHKYEKIDLTNHIYAEIPLLHGKPEVEADGKVEISDTYNQQQVEI